MIGRASRVRSERPFGYFRDLTALSATEGRP